MSKAFSLALAWMLPGLSMANDFPTQARVEFVLGCVHEEGEQSYDTEKGKAGRFVSGSG